MPDDLVLCDVGEADEQSIQEVLASQPDYALRVTGYPPGRPMR